MFKSTVGKTVLNLTAATTLFYGGGVALSLNNPTFNEIFTDNFPLADDAVDFVDSILNNKRVKEYNIKHFKEKFGDLEKTVQLPKSGIFSEKIDTAKEESLKAKESAKAVLVSKPTISLPTIQLDTQDPVLKKAIEEFNIVVTDINNAKISPSGFDSLKGLFAELDATLVSLQSKTKHALDEKINEAVAKKENDLLAKFTYDFKTQITELQKQHDAQVANEIKHAKEALDAHYANVAKEQAIQARKEFTKQIRKAIEEEREGKYANFSALDQKLTSLQDLVLKIDDHLNNSETKVKLQLSLSNLKAKLASDKNEDLSSEFAQLKQIAIESKNDVILSAVSAVDEGAVKQGLLTPAQLITRFELLTPELRSAALLPPNAGVLGHFAAKIFSTLLISKEGHAEGRDIESVIARVQTNLVRNDLDDAVEEVANLKGWSRKLADDWLVESRKRLEVEFLVSVIDLESRTLF
ncbi:MICOS complex subunit MIC60 [Cyberlindnera fabianii]|uniref:MICOS complex subunit MIC60 n=1 Tax=Cyberlindnera fabianii TaxID=36022 RepID=A0A1V2LAZ1_CYBFA|nr:MICOS complex subunit MIC60 [Cyberlindnera fabianii]